VNRCYMNLHVVCTEMQPAGPMCKLAMERGLIAITAGKGDVVRLVPPLTVSEAEIDEAVAVLADAASVALV